MRQESAFDRGGRLARARGRAAAAHAGDGTDDGADGAGTRARRRAGSCAPTTTSHSAALYLRELLDKLGGNVPLAVGAYNAGPEAITRWLGHAKGETLDVFVETIPFLETRGYVVRVMGNLARYGYMDRGEAGVPAVALELK